VQLKDRFAAEPSPHSDLSKLEVLLLANLNIP
jgi:hypothetical protein